jgi:hypothetical protein
MFSKPPPFLTVLDKIDGRAMHTQIRRNCALRTGIDKRRNDLLIGQNGLLVALSTSFQSTVPPLPDRILLVLMLGSQEQMRRIYARRIIAMVADFHFRMKRAFEVFVKQSAGNAFTRPIRHLAVAARKLAALENPTSVFVDLVAGQGFGPGFRHGTNHAQRSVAHQGVR